MPEGTEATEAQPEGTTEEAAQATEGSTGLAQDEVNKLVGKARVEARDKLLKKYGVVSEEELAAMLEEAKTLKQSQMSEAERAEERIREAEARAAAAEAERDAERLNNLRARIGREKGLPEPLIEKLVGTDEESLVAEADALLPFLRAAQAEEEDLGGGTNPASPGGMGKTPEEKWVASLAQGISAKKRGLFE